MHRGSDGVIDIMANQIHEFKGPHPKSLRTQGGVDVLHRGNAFFQDAQGFAVKRPSHSVYDEARRVLGQGRRLAPSSHLRQGMTGEIGIRLQRRNHLDQSHQRCRVEEMKANHAIGTGAPAGQGCDGQ